MTALSESLLPMLICDVFSLSILTYLHFSWVRKPVLDKDTDLSWSVLDAQALEEAEVDFGQSLVTCPEVPQKRQSLLSRQHCHSWGVSFPYFPSFEQRSGMVNFFCLEVEPLPLVEPELLFFCLE